MVFTSNRHDDKFILCSTGLSLTFFIINYKRSLLTQRRLLVHVLLFRRHETEPSICDDFVKDPLLKFSVEWLLYFPTRSRVYEMRY